MVSADNGFAKFNDALEGTHFNWTFLKLLSIDKSGLSVASNRKHLFSYPVQNLHENKYKKILSRKLLL